MDQRAAIQACGTGKLHFFSEVYSYSSLGASKAEDGFPDQATAATPLRTAFGHIVMKPYMEKIRGTTV